MNQNPEKPKRAVGLRYKHGEDDRPYVISRGEGVVAEEILKVAKENNVPIRTDGGLVDNLIKLDYMQEIPEELFELVAEVLFFAYQAMGRDIDD